MYLGSYEKRRRGRHDDVGSAADDGGGCSVVGVGVGGMRGAGRLSRGYQVFVLEPWWYAGENREGWVAMEHPAVVIGSLGSRRSQLGVYARADKASSMSPRSTRPQNVGMERQLLSALGSDNDQTSNCWLDESQCWAPRPCEEAGARREPICPVQLPVYVRARDCLDCPGPRRSRRASTHSDHLSIRAWHPGRSGRQCGGFNVWALLPYLHP